ncbi:MAG: hypothetical protein QM756_00210 [Polyangiaceae bacterium]
MPTSPDLLDCPHSRSCAGCPLSDTPYPAQLLWKREKLAAALAPYAYVSQAPVTETQPAQAHRAYRVRAKLVVDGAALGLFSQVGHAVLDIPNCRVLTPRVAGAVAAVRAALPFEFPLLALDAREVDAGVLLTLIVAPDVAKRSVEACARRLVAAHSEIVGVSLSRRAPRSPRVLGSEPEALLGLAAAPHHFSASAPFHLATPGGFVQAHAGQADQLHARIEQALSDELSGLRGRHVLELYAGAGALALRLAASGAHVTAADSYAPSLSQARHAAEAQHLKLDLLEASAEHALEPGGPLDALIVDPPRRGLTPEVRRGIAARKPRALILCVLRARHVGSRLGSPGGARAITEVDSNRGT